MTTTPFLNKSAARLALRGILQQQTTSQLAEAQARVPQHLRLFIKKQINITSPSGLAILAYQPHFRGEVNFTEILKDLGLSSKIFLPQISDQSYLKFLELKENLTLGKYGILAPTNSQELLASDFQLVIALIPGLGFDLLGNRLGRGLGFYDRFLANYPLPSKLIKIGVALDCQITQQLPIEDHDQKMDYLLTETGLIKLTPLIC